jgi:hypothetical protein
VYTHLIFTNAVCVYLLKYSCQGSATPHVVEVAFAINITSNGRAVHEPECFSVYWRSSSEDEWRPHSPISDTHVSDVSDESTYTVTVSLKHFSDYVVVAHYPAFERLGVLTIKPGSVSAYYGPTDRRNKPLTDRINERKRIAASDDTIIRVANLTEKLIHIAYTATESNEKSSSRTVNASVAVDFHAQLSAGVSGTTSHVVKSLDNQIISMKTVLPYNEPDFGTAHVQYVGDGILKQQVTLYTFEPDCDDVNRDQVHVRHSEEISVRSLLIIKPPILSDVDCLRLYDSMRYERGAIQHQRLAHIVGTANYCKTSTRTT